MDIIILEIRGKQLKTSKNHAIKLINSSKLIKNNKINIPELKQTTL